MSDLSAARRAYLDQPARYGVDDHATRCAEADAFTAGWEAAHTSATVDLPQPERFRVTSGRYVVDSALPGVLAPFNSVRSAALAAAAMNAGTSDPNGYLWVGR